MRGMREEFMDYGSVKDPTFAARTRVRVRGKDPADVPRLSLQGGSRAGHIKLAQGE